MCEGEGGEGEDMLWGVGGGGAGGARGVRRKLW